MKTIYLILICLACTLGVNAQDKRPLAIALAGLSHDHVNLIMDHYKKKEINLVGIAEPNKELVNKFKKSAGIPDSLFYDDLKVLLQRKRPEVVMAFNAISEHIDVVRVCAPLKIDVMVEKPLATSVKHAEEIAMLAKKYNTKVLTNYETTWYGTNQEIYRRVKEGRIGDVVKMVAHDGHEGPEEIGCSRFFLDWLTDPVKNGAGALNDFGCYGANLFTWLMNNQMPVSVFAVTHQIKPAIYPKVDDDATIILEYPNATGIIEASWNWPYSIKDWEVFGKTGYLQAVNNKALRTKTNKTGYEINEVTSPQAPYQSYLAYVTALLRKEIAAADDLSSLTNNIIVVKILAAAKESARTGKKVLMK
ncbi:Gfo/Idh/MocA family oxidoreductase [Niabella yanshanensis]|uniref:Gfo/Idh/MocA family oxidoreductase n=1 Tax=Niabella yanshanensis TaxID=577386 RepID=A0ABZ0W9D9_9BACT|nr:Gfo/Idh/MocA family oxidoreductase [Niabella yanshanensis]WQD39751.1 Gfo/Idh/MocA family oxidoreductase [Niabella yanshanensis]